MIAEALNAALVLMICAVLLLPMAAQRGGPVRPRPKPEFCRVTYVYDGDTVAMDCGAGEVTARISGLNAPETRDAQCAAEEAAGKRATVRLRALVRQGPVRIERIGFEKYGRHLILMWIGGQDVARIMVRERLADAYLGGGRRDWCAYFAREAQ